jgi:hypothetical protein
MKKFKLGLVLSVLLLGTMGQASLVCKGYDSSGNLIPVQAQIHFKPSRTTLAALGNTVVTIQGVSNEYNSIYLMENAQTRCAAGPTLSSDIEDKLSVELYTWNPCVSFPPASMGKTDYHGSITVKNPNGTAMTFNVGCKYDH